jgi:hypothetical protein
MNCFVALDRAPRSIKGAEAELGVDSSLDSAMILFNDVVEMRYGRQRQRRPNAPAHFRLDRKDFHPP